MTDYFDSDEPVGRCSLCQRLTWEPSMIGQTCYAPRRDDSCVGIFEGLTTTQRAYAADPNFSPYALEDFCDVDD